MAYLGINGVTCATFLAALREEQSATGGPDGFHTILFGMLMAWTDGYITAKNETELLHRLAGSTTTLQQRAHWMQLFCQANPNAPFFAAAYRLREHLVAEGL
jgi:hypothetical protein